jgi:hypothetical protein
MFTRQHYTLHHSPIYSDPENIHNISLLTIRELTTIRLHHRQALRFHQTVDEINVNGTSIISLLNIKGPNINVDRDIQSW